MSPQPTETWPALPYAQWADTRQTLHRWTQIVGKTRLALEPMLNHWWHVTLYVSARGLTTVGSARWSPRRGGCGPRPLPSAPALGAGPAAHGR